MSTYTVDLTNSLSSVKGQAVVTTRGVCPSVDSVEIRSWQEDHGAGESIEAVIEFDCSQLTGRPIDINLNVRVTTTGTLSDGRTGILTDGHDNLRSWSSVSSSFNVRGESQAHYWSSVTSVEVEITADKN